MPMFSELAREARLDALDFLRTLITDPASLADNDDDDNPDPDDTPTLDLDTLHHRRLAATALLRFYVKAADDFEYDDSDDDNDTTDPDDTDDGDGEHDDEDDTDAAPHTDPHAEPEDVFDDLSNEPDDAAADDDDTITSPRDEAADLDTESKLPAPLPSPPGPEGANERSHGCSSRQRAQPVDALIVESNRPEGAGEVVEPLTMTLRRATPAAHCSTPPPEN